MKIGIIGAGNIGGNLTRRLTGLGHDVRVANSRAPETLADLAAETGAEAVPLNEAAQGAEVVVVTIPLRAVADLPDGVLTAAAPGVVIIDTGNYYPQRDGRIEEILDGVTESRWVSNQLGQPVVKAFNNIYAAHLISAARSAGDPDRVALPVAADEARAKQQVMDLVDSLGFDPVDAGGIDESWRQQPGTPVYGTDFDADGVRRALSEASPERPADFRP
jgi:predicted dinucleotide-binding enzyme